MLEPKEAYGRWLADDRESASRLSPTEELLAEHYLMGSVLSCMEAEARRLKGGEPLRAGFWSAVIDFNGNFVHRGHRAKEELHYIPALVENELLPRPAIEAFHHEHERAKKLTLHIRDSVQSGDWEAVLRLVALYVHFLPEHMRQEEVQLFQIGGEGLPRDVNERLRAAFDAIDQRTLAGVGRRHYVDLARQLCGLTGTAS